MTTPEQPKRRTARAQRRTPWLAMISLLVLTLIVGGANLWATFDQVGQSQHKWCATLVTLDKADRHAPPPTSPFGRHLVTDFHQLRESFGCG